MYKEDFERVLKIYLIVVNALLLLIVLSIIGTGNTINWGAFFLVILLFDGIPLLVYLCAYIFLWAGLNSKRKTAYSFGSIALFLSLLFIVIPIAVNSTGGGSDADDTKECGSCYKTFERYDVWGDLDDDYTSIQLRGMCERCYENYKWLHGK